jgi:hypothetical protein
VTIRPRHPKFIQVCSPLLEDKQSSRVLFTRTLMAALFLSVGVSNVWRRLLNILLVLAISGVPLAISLLEFAVFRVDPMGADFYKSVFPGISFLGITMALVSISDYSEFGERYREYGGGGAEVLPFVMFFIYIMLIIEFILYYEFSAHSAAASVEPSKIDWSTSIVVLRLFRATTYSTVALCVLYITQMMIVWDIKITKEVVE